MLRILHAAVQMWIRPDGTQITFRICTVHCSTASTALSPHTHHEQGRHGALSRTHRFNFFKSASPRRIPTSRCRLHVGRCTSPAARPLHAVRCAVAASYKRCFQRPRPFFIRAYDRKPAHTNLEKTAKSTPTLTLRVNAGCDELCVDESDAIEVPNGRPWGAQVFRRTCCVGGAFACPDTGHLNAPV